MGTKSTKSQRSPKKRKKRQSPKQDAKAILRAQCTAVALDLRKRGFTYREIAEALAEDPVYENGEKMNSGMGLKVTQQTVYNWVSTAIAEIPREPAIELRQMHLDRLDTLLQRAWAAATEVPDLVNENAMKLVLTLMDRQARYCGLYAPDGAGGGGNAGDRVTDAINDKFIEALKAQAPVLRPDGPVPANPIL